MAGMKAKAAPAAKEEPMVKADYVAPVRKIVKDEVCAMLPHIKGTLIRKLDWWAIYSIHSEIVKYGYDPESVARKYVKGYDPAKARQEAKKAEERKNRSKDAETKVTDARSKRDAARAKAISAREKARAAREKARNAARAARERARAARQRARSKR